MAFLNRVSNLLKRNYGKSVVTGLSAGNASIFQSIRWMSSSKLFVGGLSYNTDEMSLREAFAQYGDVVEARVILDRDSGRSRGFGFVTYTSTEDASSAIQALDGQDLHGRRVRVNYATEKPRGGGFGGDFGGGGYGGQGQGGYQGGGYGGGDRYPRGGGGYGGGGGNNANLGGFGGNDFAGGFGGASENPGGYDRGFGGQDGGYGNRSSGFSGDQTGFGAATSDEMKEGRDSDDSGDDDAVKDEDDAPNGYANTRS